MNKYFYCKRWSRARKRPLEIISKEEAQNIHNEIKRYVALINSPEDIKKLLEKSEEYTVMVNSPKEPEAIIHFVSNSASVLFLDHKLREHIEYSFQVVENNKLFLSKGVQRYYQGDSDKVSKAEMFLFKEDGSLFISKTTYIPSRKRQEATNVIDVLRNYENFPSFEEYEGLLQKER